MRAVFIVSNAWRESNTSLPLCSPDRHAVGWLGMQSFFIVFTLSYNIMKKGIPPYFSLEEDSRMEHIYKLLCYPLFAVFGPLNPKLFAAKQICISSRSLYQYRLQSSSQDTCLRVGKWEFYFNGQRRKLKVSPPLTTGLFIKRLCMVKCGLFFFFVKWLES